MIACFGRFLAVAALAFGALVGSNADASAQTPITYVSAAGLSTNDCRSADKPCASLGVAVDRTATGGVVIIDGPYDGGFPSVGKSVSIIGHGAVVVAYLRISSLAANVKIQGLTFAGQNAFEYGASIAGASKVTFIDCVFTDYSEAAIYVHGPAGARITLELAEMSGNKYGVIVEGASGAANTAFIKDSFIDASTVSAVEVRGAANAAVLINSTLAGSGQVDLSRVGGGRVISYKNNVIRSGTPSQTLPTN